MEVITNRANTVAFRECALKYVSWDCTNSGWAVAPLVKCLNEEDWELYGCRTRDWRTRPGTERCGARFGECLCHTNAVVRGNALYALGRFAQNARSATPSIMEMLVDRDIYGRQGATNALRRIAPDLSA